MHYQTVEHIAEKHVKQKNMCMAGTNWILVKKDSTREALLTTTVHSGTWVQYLFPLRSHHTCGWHRRLQNCQCKQLAVRKIIFFKYMHLQKRMRTCCENIWQEQEGTASGTAAGTESTSKRLFLDGSYLMTLDGRSDAVRGSWTFSIWLDNCIP